MWQGATFEAWRPQPFLVHVKTEQRMKKGCLWADLVQVDTPTDVQCMQFRWRELDNLCTECITQGRAADNFDLLAGCQYPLTQGSPGRPGVCINKTTDVLS